METLYVLGAGSSAEKINNLLYRLSWISDFRKKNMKFSISC